VTRWASPGFLVAFGASRTIALGMYLSVVCAEDVPRIPSRGVDSRARGTFLGDALVRNLRAACDVWLPGVRAPHAPPLRSPVPTLVLTGDVDPVTPPRWGEQLLPGLPRGRQVVLAATGHVPSMSPCAATLFARFVDAGAAEGLDVSCARVSTRPPFLLEGPGPRAGPGGRTNAPATQRITDVSGRWDLHWQTTKGPSQSGYLVIRQSGAALQAEVHGDGTLEATGTSRGDSLVLSGRRIVNFEIRAIARADTLTGVLKVLTVERRFTGVRRR